MEVHAAVNRNAVANSPPANAARRLGRWPLNFAIERITRRKAPGAFKFMVFIGGWKGIGLRVVGTGIPVGKGDSFLTRVNEPCETSACYSGESHYLSLRRNHASPRQARI